MFGASAVPISSINPLAVSHGVDQSSAPLLRMKRSESKAFSLRRNNIVDGGPASHTSLRPSKGGGNEGRRGQAGYTFNNMPTHSKRI